MAIPDPEFQHVEEIFYDDLQDRFPAKLERRLRHPKALRRWSLQWKTASKSMRDQLLAQFDAAIGGCVPFSYTPIDGASPINVRFDEDSLVVRQESAVHYSMSTTLIEEVY